MSVKRVESHLLASRDVEDRETYIPKAGRPSYFEGVQSNKKRFKNSVFFTPDHFFKIAKSSRLV